MALLVPRPRNPPVTAGDTIDAHLDVPDDIQALLQRACADCHSHRTRWPWYSTVFPASWVIGRDLRMARGRLNLSRWAAYSPFDQADLLDEMCIMAGARAMPPVRYRWLHPDARLGDADIERLCAWTQASVTRLLKVYE